jgi:hypothetical protein
VKQRTVVDDGKVAEFLAIVLQIFGNVKADQIYNMDEINRKIFNNGVLTLPERWAEAYTTSFLLGRKNVLQRSRQSMWLDTN